MSFEDLAGRTFGRLFVRSSAGAGSGQNKHRLWLCQCECGAERTVRATRLRTGLVSSCHDCAIIRHGHTAGGEWSPEYGAWAAMKARCETPGSTSYDRYGALGILICAQWSRSFEAFLAYVGHKPSKDHSLDRIKNSIGYEPGNVRWATRRHQAGNKSNNVMVDYEGISICLSEYARRSGVNYNTIRTRLHHGVPLEDAIKPGSRLLGSRVYTSRVSRPLAQISFTGSSSATAAGL